MSDQRYYPYVPWDDQPVAGDVINRDRIHADTWFREGIYGPYATILKILISGDGFKLCAQDDKTLCVLETAYA